MWIGDGHDGDEVGGNPLLAEVDGDAAREGHPRVDVEEPWVGGQFGGHVHSVLLVLCWARGGLCICEVLVDDCKRKMISEKSLDRDSSLLYTSQIFIL